MTKVPSGREVSAIAPDRLDALNSGTAEAAVLTECLAVDFAKLMHHAIPQLGAGAVATLKQASGEGISRRMTLAGRLIYNGLGLGIAETLRSHPSDTVRGWACFVIAADESLTLSNRLDLMKPLADGRHFGVREWAWMAVRTDIAQDIGNAISELTVWTKEPSERLRRFASEATRPRGVWCKHIDALKQAPELGLPILEPLRADPSAYVQDSVGNWLNDASKTQALWVRNHCDRWLHESSNPITARICKRALRSLPRNT